ncbi:MAG: hypothetical protein R3D29_09475 [Nitratireductor sp.]
MPVAPALIVHRDFDKMGGDTLRDARHDPYEIVEYKVGERAVLKRRENFHLVEGRALSRWYRSSIMVMTPAMP